MVNYEEKQAIICADMIASVIAKIDINFNDAFRKVFHAELDKIISELEDDKETDTVSICELFKLLK